MSDRLQRRNNSHGLFLHLRRNHLRRTAVTTNAIQSGSGMNMAMAIGPTMDMSASGCGSDSFISTIGRPVFWIPVSMAIVRTRAVGWRSSRATAPLSRNLQRSST